jgi:hypothetical protein
MRGTPGQIRIEGDAIAGDGADYRSPWLEIRGGIITRLTYPADQNSTGTLDSDAGGFIGLVIRHPQPSTWDFSLTTSPPLVTDGTTQTLCLKHIVPKEAFAVLIQCEVKDGQAGSEIKFRNPDHGNYIGEPHFITVIANQLVCGQGILHLSTNCNISYTATNLTFTECQFVVKGWWVK